MKQTPRDLKTISALTLEDYDHRAEAFWQGTRDHDVSENIATLLHYIEAEKPATLLDFGCGPGRDLRVFADLGHIAIGLEGAPHFVTMARAHSGCEVWQQDFLDLDLPENIFDGVFANANTFSRPEPGVAARLAAAAWMPETRRRPVQLESPRAKRGRLEPWVLLRLS